MIHVIQRRWPNPPPSAPDWFACSMGYRPTMKISCPDSESPQKTSLDTSQTIPFRGGHPTLISATITDLAILGVILRISCFSVQIWILLNKPVKTQVKPFHSEEVTQPLISATIIDLAISWVMVRILNFPIWIWILLENWVQGQVEPSQSENFSWPAPPGAPITVLGVIHATHKIGSQDLDILNLLEKWV